MKRIFAAWDGLACARWLVIAELVSLFISTSLTSAVEILLFVSVICCWGRLRGRLSLLLQQPVVIMFLVFTGVLFLGLFYGPAPLADKLAILKGWRKLLLLPMAILLFDDTRWKQRLTWAIILVATLSMLRSYAGLLGYGSTVVVHNPATQGMFFAVAAFAAVVMLFSRHVSLTPAMRWGMGVTIVLLVADVIFVNSGRSGYLALLVLAVMAGVGLFRGWLRVGMVVAVPMVLVVLLALSPVATTRMGIAWHDMHRYEELTRETDMGIRRVMWKNTLQLIIERPFLGYGLGGFKEAYRKHVEGVEGWKGIAVDDPHNQYLKVAADHGVVGLFVFLGFIGSFFRQKVLSPYRLLGLGVLLAWCATSLFSGHFGTWGEGRFIMLWAGSQFAIGNFAVGSESG